MPSTRPKSRTVTRKRTDKSKAGATDPTAPTTSGVRRWRIVKPREPSATAKRRKVLKAVAGIAVEDNVANAATVPLSPILHQSPPPLSTTLPSTPLVNLSASPVLDAHSLANIFVSSMQVANGDLPNWDGSAIFPEHGVPVIDVTIHSPPRRQLIVCDVTPEMSNYASIGGILSYHSDGGLFSAMELNPPETTMHRSEYEPATTPTYRINVSGTNKGGNQVTDGLGFTYSFHKASKRSASWRCTSRPAKNPCKATVLQKITCEAYLMSMEPSSW